MEGRTHLANQQYFDRIYRESEDPWRYESSEYETSKYGASLDALPNSQYTNALEIGCSIGVFTEKLAPRCARLLSIDIAVSAVEKAKERCARFQNVSFRAMSVPEEYPSGSFDLTVLSEVGYYLSPERLANLADQITSQAVCGGHLLLVHWRPSVPGYQLRGDDVHEHFLRIPAWFPTFGSQTDSYRIDVLEWR